MKKLQWELDEISAGFRYIMVNEQKKLVEEAYRTPDLSLEKKGKLSRLGVGMSETKYNIEKVHGVDKMLKKINEMDLDEYNIE